MVRMIMDGQPESNIREVQEMILNYIKQAECLVLSVSPANQDLATSNVLEIARTINPQMNGKTIVGVVDAYDKD
ncbi:hypothetical protein CDAR_288311, partial [Caerostris darwini]